MSRVCTTRARPVRVRPARSAHRSGCVRMPRCGQFVYQTNWMGDRPMPPVLQSTVTYELSANDGRQVTELVERLIEGYSSPENPAFVATTADLARSLPDG